MKDGRSCGFCGKDAHEVQKLIAGPDTFICDECVSMCVGIIQASDNTFFNKIKCEIKGDREMKRAGMRVIEASDEFWKLMEQEDIYSRLAAAILVQHGDMTEALAERAYNLMSKSRAAGQLAWKTIHEAHPGTEGKQMSAAAGIRKIYVEQ